MSTRTIKIIREATNEMSEQLTSENKQFFVKIRSYLQLSSLLLDEKSVVEQTHQIVSDLLEAQENGESAEAFFGAKPKEVADEIIRNMPQATLKARSSLMLMALVVFWGSLFINSFIYTKETMINWVAYIMVALLVPVFIILLVKLAKQDVYLKDKKRQWLISMGYFFLSFVFILGCAGLFLGFGNSWQLNIPMPYNIILLSSFIVMLLVIAMSKRVAENVIPFMGYGVEVVVVYSYLLIFIKLESKKEAR